METFDYNLDGDNFEIFPSEIWKDPFVVFHGTSAFHSDNIEKNGFVKGQSPFDLTDGKELVRVLQLPEVIPYDEKSFIGMTTATTLQSYINAIENNGFRLSFSYLSYQCVLFASGQAKGGQTFGNIRKAKQILDTAIAENKIAQSAITQPIERLFELEESIRNDRGFVYAIKLPQDLKEKTCETNVIYSTVSVPKECLVGKVMLPDNIEISQDERKRVSEKNKSKLFTAGHLGILLNRQRF